MWQKPGTEKGMYVYIQVTSHRSFQNKLPEDLIFQNRRKYVMDVEYPRPRQWDLTYRN